MTKLALHWKILIGMALGVLFGAFLSFIPNGSEFIKNYIKPFGTIFINLLNAQVNFNSIPQNKQLIK